MNFDRNPKQVQIFDTTNRDGEQGTQGALYPDSKLAIARAFSEAGVNRIEAGFPTSSKKDFKTVRLIAGEIKNSMIFGLSPVPIMAPGKEGTDKIERTYEAVKSAMYPGIHVFSIMFDPKSLASYGYSMEQVMEGSIKGVACARSLLGNRGQVEFSFQNAASAPLEWIVDGYRRIVEAGADVINVPDTNGSRSPEEVKSVISALRKALPDYTLISVHMHNDFGLAVANSLAAVCAGADIVEGTINGIGERAGNAALEEVIASLNFRHELYGNRTTTINASKLNYLSRLVSSNYGTHVPEHKAIVGDNAFRHRSGIHQDGTVKGSVYSFVDPKKVGWIGETFGLSARSGSAGVCQRLRQLGYDVTPVFVKSSVLPLFKELADRKREITDSDLSTLMAELKPVGIQQN